MLKVREASRIALVVVAAGCAAAPNRSSEPAALPASAPQPAVARSAAEMTDRAGDSTETAVAVPVDALNEGVDFQNEWIFNRYGRFRRLKWGMAHAGERRYDVITVELPDHTEHVVFFDITEMWKAWKPPK
ncbi:MAG: hypothetical protein NVSMB68_03370 [Thermoanaerobaculia bacterium]